MCLLLAINSSISSLLLFATKLSWISSDNLFAALSKSLIPLMCSFFDGLSIDITSKSSSSDWLISKISTSSSFFFSSFLSSGTLVVLFSSFWAFLVSFASKYFWIFIFVLIELMFSLEGNELRQSVYSFCICIK